MQKFFKYFGIMLMVALVFALAGCSLVQKNEDRYNNQIAVKVGNEEITLKQVMEFFDSNGGNYINSGYDAQTVWDALFAQYVQQMIGVDEYKKSYEGTKYSGERSLKYANGEYYTEEELAYLEKSLQVDILSSLDSLFETELKDLGYTLSEAEDNERDEMKEIKIDTNLSLTARKEAYNHKKLDKSLESYKIQPVTNDITYVYDNKDDERLVAALEKLNARIAEDDEKVSPELYIELQEVALQKFERSLTNTYYDSISEYMESRMELLIKQQLYVDYQYKYGSEVEAKDMNAELQVKLNYLVAQAKEGYKLDPASFVTFVTGLSNTSFIYDVPEQYVGKYGFVKNMLIPFSDEQTQKLTTIANKFGTDSVTYLRLRAELAQEILVTDFIDAPDAEDADKANAQFIINDKYEVVGSEFFASMLDNCTKEEFVNLMFRYNTDTAQHNAAYDYVISKDEPDVTGVADTWVKEFASVARTLAKDGTVGGIGYALTTYGVHIIYYSGDVVADEFDWAKKLDDQVGAGTAVYRFYNTYYNSVLSTLFSRNMDNLNKKYIEDESITYYEDVMKEYLDSYGITLFSQDAE